MTREELEIIVMDLKTRLTPIEAGISNFREFQQDQRQKVGFVYGAAWVAAILVPIILGIIVWFLTAVVWPAASLVIQDYYQRHPKAAVQYQESIDNMPYPVDAKEVVPPPQKTLENPPPELR